MQKYEMQPSTCAAFAELNRNKCVEGRMWNYEKIAKDAFTGFVFSSYHDDFGMGMEDMTRAWVLLQWLSGQPGPSKL